MVFTIYELSNTFCKVTDSLAYSSSMEDENQRELKLDVCEITPVVIPKTGHFMNSVLNTSHIYSYAVDSFFDVTSCFFSLVYQIWLWEIL